MSCPRAPDPLTIATDERIFVVIIGSVVASSVMTGSKADRVGSSFGAAMDPVHLRPLRTPGMTKAAHHRQLCLEQLFAGLEQRLDRLQLLLGRGLAPSRIEVIGQLGRLDGSDVATDPPHVLALEQIMQIRIEVGVDRHWLRHRSQRLSRRLATGWMLTPRPTVTRGQPQQATQGRQDQANSLQRGTAQTHRTHSQ